MEHDNPFCARLVRNLEVSVPLCFIGQPVCDNQAEFFSVDALVGLLG